MTIGFIINSFGWFLAIGGTLCYCKLYTTFFNFTKGLCVFAIFIISIHNSDQLGSVLGLTGPS